MTLAAAALGELTELFPINQLKLTGSKKCLVRPGIWRLKNWDRFSVVKKEGKEKPMRKLIVLMKTDRKTVN